MNRAEFNEQKDRFIAELPVLNLSNQTVRSYTNVLSCFSDYIRDNDFDAVSEAVKSYRDEKSKSVKANTVNYHLIVLGRFFDWCGCENPVNDVEKMKGEEIKRDLLTLEEIETLLHASARTDTDRRNRAVMLMLMQTGVRNSELRSLRLSDLDFENGTIKVQKGKGNKSRIVAFPKLAKEAVLRYLASGFRPSGLPEDAPLFGTTADAFGKRGRTDWHPMCADTLTSTMKKYVQKMTGHAGIGAHDLRHAYASYASHRGVPTRQLSLSMGHASETTTTKVYISVLDNQRAAQVVNSLLDA